MTQLQWDYDRTDPPPYKRRLHVGCGGPVMMPDGVPHCTRCGLTDDNGGWLKRLLMWHWHQVGFDGFPGWDLVESSTGRNPPWVKIRVINKRTKSSDDIANEWDNLSEGRFYNRDYSLDGSCYVGEGEAYEAGFWFQKTSDRDKFVERYRELVVEVV